MKGFRNDPKRLVLVFDCMKSVVLRRLGDFETGAEGSSGSERIGEQGYCLDVAGCKEKLTGGDKVYLGGCYDACGCAFDERTDVAARESDEEGTDVKCLNGHGDDAGCYEIVLENMLFGNSATVSDGGAFARLEKRANRACFNSDKLKACKNLREMSKNGLNGLKTPKRECFGAHGDVYNLAFKGKDDIYEMKYNKLSKNRPFMTEKTLKGGFVYKKRIKVLLVDVFAVGVAVFGVFCIVRRMKRLFK